MVALERLAQILHDRAAVVREQVAALKVEALEAEDPQVVEVEADKVEDRAAKADPVGLVELANNPFSRKFLRTKLPREVPETPSLVFRNRIRAFG